MNAQDWIVYNEEIIADFLRRSEKLLPDAAVSVMWGKSNPSLSKDLQGLLNEIQATRSAVIFLFEAANKNKS